MRIPVYAQNMPSPLPLPSKQLGLALRRWRTLNCVKQASLGTELGVSQAKISRWESGTLSPDDWESGRIMQFLSASQNVRNDAALIHLVKNSSLPVHLMCDFSHRLIAASIARSAQWRVAGEELAGKSLWRFATEGIAKAEEDLGAHGWYDPFPADVVVVTENADFAEVSIKAGPLRYARMPLSDGSFARLVWDEPRLCAE
ncbi:MAG: helix-turn-helix transcriptional regulator [Usitatibacteraceae bacterium]